MNDARERLKAVYQDLRNQRLLPVAVILIVAIIAVPMALGSGGTEVAPKTELAVGIEPLAESQPVVVAATPELRNFHKRLNEFAKKNPFHQPQPLPAPKSGSSAGSGADASASGSATADTSAVTATSTDTSAATTPTDTLGATTTPTDNSGTTTTPTDNSGTTTTPTDSGTTTTPTDTGTTGSGSTDTGTSGSGSQVLTYVVDVLVGVVGEEKEMSGVKSLDLLPGDSHPVLQYVTTDLGGSRASFVVSNAVTNADGTGRCAPSRFDCEFLQLSVGESEKLEYGPTSRTYRVKLLGITQHLDPLKTVGDAAGSVSGRIGFSAGLASTDTSFTPAG